MGTKRNSLVNKVIFKRYRITAELSGEGGMALLWLGEDTTNRSKVAVKQLRPELLSEADCQVMIKRFENEAHMQLPSEHVVRGYQFDREGNDYFYVMEYVAGKDLSKIIHPQKDHTVDTGTPLPEDRVVSIATQAAEGLGCAHAHGIVHRDVKPANIMVTTTDAVKLTDFGIACFTTKARQTTLGTQMGSPYWESPEQYDDASLADARSDIWSLGVVMYEALTGGVPFYDTMESGLYRKIKYEDPPDLGQQTSGRVSEKTRKAVMRCLEKDPDRRFQSMADLCTALGAGGAAAFSLCPGCQTQIPTGAHFCPKCGRTLGLVGAAQLVVIGGSGTGQTFSLDRDLTHLGRTSSADVVLMDDFVSRRHAVIRREAGGYCVVDGWGDGQQSTNGTYVNGQKTAVGKPVLLHPGDCLRFGDTFVRFELV